MAQLIGFGRGRWPLLDYLREIVEMGREVGIKWNKREGWEAGKNIYERGRLGDYMGLNGIAWEDV